jgi:hypothetical protein
MTTKSDAILTSADSVLLVDWPSTALPRGLLGSGLRVFGYSPSGYSSAHLFEEKPGDPDLRCFAPERPGEKGFLVFKRMAGPPEGVDVVCVYRPSEELPQIIKSQVAPLGAKMLWLQPPVTSAQAPELAAELGVECVAGVDLRERALQLRVKAS